MLTRNGIMIIDDNGIVKSIGDFSLGLTPVELPYAFSFYPCIIRTENEPKIEFGLAVRDHKDFVFNYAYVLNECRSKNIRPQIPCDGVGVIIRLLLEKRRIIVYVNNYQYYEYRLNIENVRTDDFIFFLKLEGCPDESVFGTSLLRKGNQRFVLFPNYESCKWDTDTPFIVGVDRFITYRSIYDLSCLEKRVLVAEPLFKIHEKSGDCYYYEVTVVYCFNTHINGNKIGLKTSDDFQDTLFFDFTQNKFCFGNQCTEKVDMQDDCILGFGYKEDSGYFCTCDGRLIGLFEDSKMEGVYEFSPFLCLISKHFEYRFNFGQCPFCFNLFDIVNGWCLYYPVHKPENIMGPNPQNQI